jgi:hypothetical protein
MTDKFGTGLNIGDREKMLNTAVTLKGLNVKEARRCHDKINGLADGLIVVGELAMTISSRLFGFESYVEAKEKVSCALE